MKLKMILLILLLPLVVMAQTSRVVRHVVLQSGGPATGKDVDLYQGASKIYDLTETLPGVYEHAAVSHGEYDLFVDGVEKYADIWIGSESISTFMTASVNGSNEVTAIAPLTVESGDIQTSAVSSGNLHTNVCDNSTIELYSGQLRLKDDGVSSSKILDDTITGNDLSTTVADDSTLEMNDFLGYEYLRVKEQGIQIEHLDTTVVDDQTLYYSGSGLQVKAGGIASLQLADTCVAGKHLHSSVVDDTTIAIQWDALRLKDGGIEGDHLSADTASMVRQEDIRYGHQILFAPFDLAAWENDSVSTSAASWKIDDCLIWFRSAVVPFLAIEGQAYIQAAYDVTCVVTPGYYGKVRLRVLNAATGATEAQSTIETYNGNDSYATCTVDISSINRSGGAGGKRYVLLLELYLERAAGDYLIVDNPCINIFYENYALGR